MDGVGGATGRLVVKQLLSRDVATTAIVRPLNALPDNANSLKIEAAIHNLTSTDMGFHLKDCRAVVSCLGYNLMFKGMFDKSHWLVTDTVHCTAVL